MQLSWTGPVAKESTEGEELKKLRFLKFETGMWRWELFGWAKFLTARLNNQMSIHQPKSSVDLLKLSSVEVFSLPFLHKNVLKCAKNMYAIKPMHW